MTTKTVLFSVSCPRQIAEFIENAKISPSQLFQEAAITKKEAWDGFNSEKKIIEKRLEGLQKIYARMEQFIQLKNLEDEYINWFREETKKELSKNEHI